MKRRAPSDAARPVVSDHAVLRCLQRVLGVDVELLRTLIDEATADGREAVAAELGRDVRFAVVTDQAKYLVERGYVVTTLGPRDRFRLRAGRRRRRS